MAGNQPTEAAAVAAVAAPTLTRAQFDALNAEGDRLTAARDRLGSIMGDMQRIPGLPEPFQDDIARRYEAMRREVDAIIGGLLILQINTIQRQAGVNRTRV